MHFRKILRTQRDWLIALLTALALVTFIVIGFIMLNDNKPAPIQDSIRFKEYPSTSNEIYPIVPPDPKFPPPAQTQRGFYQTYTEGGIQYSIEWEDRNVPRNPTIGPHTFVVVLYNSLNKEVDIVGPGLERVTVGCIARDEPYRAVAVPVKPLSLKPYERKVQEFSMDVRCMYLGTADKSYFWRIY